MSLRWLIYISVDAKCRPHHMSSLILNKSFWMISSFLSNSSLTSQLALIYLPPIHALSMLGSFNSLANQTARPAPRLGESIAAFADPVSWPMRCGNDVLETCCNYVNCDQSDPACTDPGGIYSSRRCVTTAPGWIIYALIPLVLFSVWRYSTSDYRFVWIYDKVWKTQFYRLYIRLDIGIEPRWAQ